MSSTLSQKIRGLLRDSVNPLTIQEIAFALGSRDTSVRRALQHNMPDAYIKAWREAYRVRPSQLWSVVVPPDDAPMPATKWSSIVRNKARDTKPKAMPKVVKPPKVVASKFKPQGLTQIRGPWPH